MAGDSIRDVLNEVVAEASGGESPQAGVGNGQTTDAAPAPGSPAVDASVGGGGDGGDPQAVASGDSVRSRDEAGRFAKGKAKAEAAAKAQAPVVVDLAKTGAPAAQVAAAPAVEPLKPPQSWKPAAREKWATLPPEAQAEVHRREKEVATALQEAAPARKLAAEFSQTIAPYEALMRAAGIEPLQAVNSMFRTEYALRTGTPAQRAQLMAKLIGDYGVDIPALDAALTGAAPAANGQAKTVDPGVIAQQVRQQIMGELQRHREQHTGQKTQAELATFAKDRDFFEDVREDMADLIQARAARGVELSLEDAYNLACKLNPDVAGVVQQREAAKAANASQASTQRAKAAASSLKSQPSGVSAPQGNGSIGDDLRATIAELNRR